MSLSSCSKLVARFVIGILLAGAAFCQSISIVSGDGQAVLVSNLVSEQPLVVLVRDAAGNPLPNASVTWAVVTAQGGALTFTTTKTDSTGQTTNNFVPAGLSLGASFFQTQINAVYSSSTVTFTETVVGQSAGAPLVEMSLVTPPLGTTFVGAAGQQSTTKIQVLVQGVAGGQAGQPLSHILITFGPADKTYTSTLTCAEGSSLYTNTHGLVTCTPVFGGAVGTGVLLVNGGSLGSFTYNYQVTVGPPAVIVIVSGNNQYGQPGVPLPRPLVAQVTDVAGNWLPGITLNFRAIVPGTVAFSNISNVSDVHGEVSAVATPGNVSGPVQVSVETTDGKVFATFTINVAVNVGQILKTGDQQTGITGQPFADPLVVTVSDPNGNPIVGAQVVFAVTQGSAILGTPAAVTNAQGQASTTVTAGSTPGAIVITATVGQTVATFNLTSRIKGPSCTPGQTFYNGAGFQANWISPGGVATIYCVGLAQGIQGSVVPNLFGPLPTQVAGVSVTFATATDPNAQSATPNAPIFNVSNYNGSESVTVQVPLEAMTGQAVPVTITAGGASASVTATILLAAPGVFDTGPVLEDGRRLAVVLRPDGSVVSSSNPIQRGETGRAFVTGLIGPTGLTTNAQLPIDSDIVITTPVIVGINNGGTKVDSVKYAANLVGVWEVQFEVAADATPGNSAPFVIAIPVPGTSTKAFSQTSDLPIQ